MCLKTNRLILIGLFWAAPFFAYAQEKLFAYYGEKLTEFQKELQGEWVLESYDGPDGVVVTDFFKKIPDAKNKVLTITADSVSFDKEKCQVKRIHRTNPKLSFFDILVYEGDPHNYPDYFQNKFLKKNCLKEKADPYSYAQLKKKAEAGVIFDCKNNTTFMPSDLILLGDNELFSVLEDYYVCYRKK